MVRKSSSNNGEAKRLFRKLSGREKTLVIVFLAALLAGAWLPGRIIVATSASLDKRVFFLSPVNTHKIRIGDYLVFIHADTTFVPQGLNKDNNYLIKQAGCVPGGILTRDEDGGFYCGGSFLGKALEQDSSRRELPRFEYSGAVPADSYFMVGSNPRSYDSRYFGFVHADEILYKALPLW
jgi:type IV secretory pathway protease TraF